MGAAMEIEMEEHTITIHDLTTFRIDSSAHHPDAGIMTI